MKTKTRPMPFEDALARLSEIVSELERPELGLEASLALFEEGVALSRFCSSKIDEIKKRVEVVLKETPQGFVTEELDGAEAAVAAEEDEDEEEDEREKPLP